MIPISGMDGTNCGKILVEHSGVGYGNPNSYRAEAWGMLSASLLIHLLHDYCGRTQIFSTMDLVLLADNAALIHTLKRRSQYTKVFPNATLAPEWDVLEQIHTTTCSLPFKTISYEWVRGHQDNSTSPCLSVEARYNVRADELASQVTNKGHDQHPLWVLPSEKVQLIMGGRPVTSQYITAIRRAATIPPLLQYLRHCHSWSQQTIQKVDWALYKSACSNSTLTSIQLCKLVHGKLPSRYELSKINPAQAHICPHCGDPDSYPHLIRCTSSVSQQF